MIPIRKFVSMNANTTRNATETKNVVRTDARCGVYIQEERTAKPKSAKLDTNVHWIQSELPSARQFRADRMVRWLI